MRVWQKYLFKRWIKAVGYMSILSCSAYMFLKKESITVQQLESLLIVVSTLVCFALGFIQVTFDYPLVLQIKAKRQCYLKYMGLGSLIGCLALLILEKIIFGFLEGTGLEGLVWEQCIYRYSALVLMNFLGSMMASVFYRFTRIIAICLIGSIIFIGIGSFAWGMLSSNIIIAIICNFYMMLIRGLTNIVGTVSYSVICGAVTYGLLAKAPIKAYQCDLL